MFGQNPVRKQDLKPDGTLWVQEIFATLQGEGMHAGTPSIFIRLAGCNLQCAFCDTDFESGFKSSLNFMSVPHISVVVNRLTAQYPGCRNIVLTGGEPFRQNIIPLVRHLLARGFTIEIETAGTLWLDDFEDFARDCHITVSPKTPKLNEWIELVADVYKYVVGEDNIYRSMPTTMNGKPLPMPTIQQAIFIQPMDDPDISKATRNIAAAVALAKKTGWRLSVQTHKYLGVP